MRKDSRQRAALHDRRTSSCNSFIGPATVIFSTALALRVLHIVQIRHSPFFSVLAGDGHTYDEWAQRLATGDWIGHDVFYQAPLYPYLVGVFYALWGRDLLALRFCQALLGAVGCVYLGVAGRNFVSKRVGAIAGLILATYAPAIFFDGLIQKSVLDVLFVCITLWVISVLTMNKLALRYWFYLGLAMGGLILTRENTWALVGVVLWWALYENGPGLFAPRRLSRAAVFLSALSLILIPVAARNTFAGGEFVVTTAQFGPNLYIGNSEHANGTYTPLRVGRGDPEYERRDATDLAERALGRQLSPREISGFWADRALSFITSQPIAWLNLTMRKVLLLWNVTEVIDTESQDTYAEWSVILRALGSITHFGTLVPLAILGMVVCWSQRPLRILYALMLAYALSIVVFYIVARYRLPLVPFLALFASAGLGGLRAAVRWWSVQKKLYVGVVLSIVTGVVNKPVLESRLMNATSENNIGSALQSAGHLREALEYFQRAVAHAPAFAQPYNNIGTILRVTGKPQEAIASYEMAIHLDPRLYQAHVNWGNVLLDLEQYGDAIEHLRIGLQSEPDDVRIMNSLAGALAGSGDTAAAIEVLRRAAEVDPSSAETHRNLGSALVESGGEINEGIAHLRRATTLRPNDPLSHRRLGRALLTSGRSDEALIHLRIASALDPKSAAAQVDLGVALGSTGRFDEAIEAFRQALALQPDAQDIRQNLEATIAARQRMRSLQRSSSKR
jgi:tetratricopeptide (TPR) repeat protein/4-amino-4-deoxy-L-arabinose transferase-like glycosyltransferase